MKLDFGIGKRTESVVVDDNDLLGILLPNEVEIELAGEDAVKAALSAPIGRQRLSDMQLNGKKIAIVTSDITRPMPTARVMPLLLDELYAGGAQKENITLVFALGSHRKHTEEEKKYLAGDRAYSEVACVDSNTDDCVHFGVTSRGTPVDIDKAVANADIRICLGNIEYHYFAGYSGGAKAIMPGVSTRAAIQSNHKFMVRLEACAGRITGNPVREDIEEAASMVGVDFILNVVLDPKKQIIFAVAGDVTKAHRKGCEFLDSLYLKKIPQKAEIVIASQGGAPKDINLYQTQKALDNAKHAVKDGGVVILVGSCKEGLGEKTFEEWMTSAKCPNDLIDRIEQEFKLGGHKAAAIAMVMQYADIYLVSDMEHDKVKSIFMTPFDTLEEAYAAAKERCGENAKVWAMPFAGSVLPKLT